MDKVTWVVFFRVFGFSEVDMDRWHIVFEIIDLERHWQFLVLFGFLEVEVT